MSNILITMLNLLYAPLSECISKLAYVYKKWSMAMIERQILILFPLIAIGAIFYYVNVVNQDITEIENSNIIPLEFEDNKVQCPQCNMFLVGK